MDYREATMSPKLPSLAIEIIELIASFLDDLRSLRLVCRQINEKTLNNFGLTHFASTQTDLSRKSLEQIQRISKSEHLAKHVQCLKVEYSEGGVLGHDFDWPRHPSGCLAEPLEAADLLHEILSHRLLKCRSFFIKGYDEYEPPHATDFLVPSDAVGLLLSIVAKADLALHSFALRSSHNGSGRLATPRLQTSLSQTPEFIDVWSHLEELVLAYAISSDQWDWVLHLISSAKRLRKLSLDFYEGQVPFIQRLSSIHELNMLEDLTLGSAKVTVDTMTSLLLRNRLTLHSLSLQLTSLDDRGEWTEIFEKMRGQFPRLQHLVLFWLKQETGDGRFKFSQFLKHPVVPGSEEPDSRRRFDTRRLDGTVQDTVRMRYWGKGPRAVGIEYHGERIDRVLSILTETVDVN